jgi:formyl-CoA transferase
MLEDSHIAAREAIIKIAHPLFGDIKMQGTFPKLSDTPGEVRWGGPELGEHTDAVLRDVLGYDEAKVEALRAAGVV